MSQRGPQDDLLELVDDVRKAADNELSREGNDPETIDFVFGLLDDAEALEEEWVTVDRGDPTERALLSGGAVTAAGALGLMAAGLFHARHAGVALLASASAVAAAVGRRRGRRDLLEQRTRHRTRRLRRELARLGPIPL